MSDENVYKIGTLVWGKMKGFPPWPGRVAEPPSDLKRPAAKKNIHCIYFFGSKNYAWLEDNCLKMYDEHKQALLHAAKTVAFKEAVEAIEAYKNNKEENGENGVVEPEVEDAFDKIKNLPVPSLKRKKSEKKSISASSAPKNNGEKRRSRTDPISQVLSNHAPSPSGSNCNRKQSLLDRPSSFLDMDMSSSQSLDMSIISQTLKDKNVEPSSSKFGFLGIGHMGSGILKNLLNSGHQVTIWNRTSEKCVEFEKIGAQVGLTPSDVIQAADITFSCVSSPTAAKEMVFGNCGVLTEMSPNKGYIEMTSIDMETSVDISEAIIQHGGRYLEAQIQGSKTESGEGSLVILAAGDKTLFDECYSCFVAMSKKTFYMGEIGNACKMNLVLQMINGITLASLAESLALADRAGLKQKDVMEILSLTSISSRALMEKGEQMVSGSYTTNMPLQHMQKDLNLALSLGNALEQSLGLTATANEMYKHAKRLGYSDHDASAIYIRARF